MGFPADASDRANRIAARIDDADDPAAALYSVTEQFDYGLSGALQDQAWMRYPDEVDDDGERTCYEDAVFVYAVADALGLNPRFFKVGIQGGHGLVDVELDGERVVIDENYGLCGPVAFYDDGEIVLDESRVDGKTRETYDWIREVGEDELLDEIENLRENPAGMLVDGQRVATYDLDGDTVYDKLIFDEDKQVLERRVDVSSSKGVYSPMVRVKRTFDGDGDISDTWTVYADTRGSNRNEIWGQVRIGVDEGGGIAFEEELPDPFLAHVSNFVQYEEERGDGLVHDESELERFRDRLLDAYEDVLDDPTGFEGKQLGQRLDWLRDNDVDRDRRLQDLDWFLFRATTDAPDDVTGLLARYVEGHREALAHVREQDDGAVAAAIDGVSGYLAAQAAEDDLAATVRDAGLAVVYGDIADALAAGTVEDAVADYRDVILTTPAIHDDILPETDDEVLGLLAEGPVAFEHAAYEGTQRWHYDEEERELQHVLTLDDHDISYYESQLVYSCTFDAAGNLDEQRLRIEDTLPEVNDGYVLFDQAIDGLGDVTMDDLQDAFAARVAEVQEDPVLSAPMPHRDTTFLEKNAAAIGLYSCIGIDDEDPSLIVDDEELDGFFDQLLDELSYVAESDHLPVADQEQAATDHEHMQDVRESDEYGQIAALNWVKSQVLNGAEDVVRERVEDAFTTEEMARQYMKKFADAFNQHYWTDAFGETRDQLQELVSAGIDRSVPEPQTVDAFADEHGYPELAAANDMLDSRRPWAEKGPEIEETLDEASAVLLNPGSAYERRATVDALRSFEHRMVQRDRYHDWATGADEELVETVASLRKQVADTPPTVSVSDEHAEALLETFQQMES